MKATVAEASEWKGEYDASCTRKRMTKAVEATWTGKRKTIAAETRKIMTPRKRDAAGAKATRKRRIPSTIAAEGKWRREVIVVEAIGRKMMVTIPVTGKERRAAGE